MRDPQSAWLRRLLLGMVLCAPLAGAASSRALAEEKRMAFVGKRILIRYESGLDVRGDYRSATELAWEALAGPSKGKTGKETIQALEVAPNVFFISWVESSGVTVSQVLDLERSRVSAFVTFDSPGGRRGLLDRGTFTDVAP